MDYIVKEEKIRYTIDKKGERFNKSYLISLEVYAGLKPKPSSLLL